MQVQSPAEEVACGVSTPDAERRHVPEVRRFSPLVVRRFRDLGVFRSREDRPTQDVRGGLLCWRVGVMCLNASKRMAAIAADCVPSLCRWSAGLRHMAAWHHRYEDR